MKPLNISTSEKNDVCVLQLSGDVDLSTADTLRAKLTEVAERRVGHIHLDLRFVDYIGSTGVALLVSCLRRLKDEGRELKIVACSPSVAKVFRLLRLDYLLPFDTVAMTHALVRA